MIYIDKTPKSWKQRKTHKLRIQGRVYVSFVISKDGQIINIKMRGPDKNLEKEEKRIISKLPKMIPGKQIGQLVRVPFSIHTVFILQQNLQFV